MCNNWPDYPIGVYGATGGLIGDTVIICGGLNLDNEMCYSLTSEEATFVTHMSVRRWFAASIVLNDNKLWVTGGYGFNWGISSTEYVTVTGAMPGPDLPFNLHHHAMVAINRTCSMIIGGIGGSTAGSWSFFYDHNEEEWIPGPSLMQGRASPAAGIVTDEVTYEDFVAVTGGWDLYSTEILQDGTWVQGKINSHF